MIYFDYQEKSMIYWKRCFFMDFTQLKALSDWCSDYSQKMNTVSVYIKNHKDEFENHVFYDKMNCNKTYLDDFACELLAKKYNVANSQVISNGQMWDELQSAKQENEALRAEIAEMKENMIPQLIQQVSEQMLNVTMQSIQPLLLQMQQSQQILLEQKNLPNPDDDVLLQNLREQYQKKEHNAKRELKILERQIVSVMNSKYVDMELLEYLHMRRRVLENTLKSLKKS